MRIAEQVSEEDFWESRESLELDLLFMAHSAVSLGKVHAYQADDLSATKISIEGGDIYHPLGEQKFYYQVNPGNRFEIGLDIEPKSEELSTGRTLLRHFVYAADGLMVRKSLSYFISPDRTGMVLVNETEWMPINQRTIPSMARMSIAAARSQHKSRYQTE